MKTAFLILGAQRSGTSVTSHMLSLFGISFGDAKHFLQAEHNPTFFELKWVNQFNDRLIQRFGYRYIDRFLPIESDYDRSDLIEIAHELPHLIRREWQNAPVIGIKDPRICLTFPVWRQALLVEGYRLQMIFVVRHPGGFLRSNQKLFHNWEGWDAEKHLHFWLRLNLAAVYFTRDYPVYQVSYEEVMNHPLTVAKRLAIDLGLDERQAAAAAAVVDRTYYHHTQSNPTGYPLIDQYYQLLCSQQLTAADYLNYRSYALNAN